MTAPFVPRDFVVPETLDGPGFRLEPLGPEHNERDHEAWMSSIEYIKAIPAFSGGDWPAAMSLDQNLSDLEGHARDFDSRQGFTYSILDGDDVIGCMYLYPSQDADHDAHMKWWLTESRSDLAPTVGAELNSWLTSAWPFENPTTVRR